MFPSLPYIVIQVVCLSQFWTKFDKICRRTIYRPIYICQIGLQVIFTIFCIFQNGGQAKLQIISINQEMRRKQQLDNIFEGYKWFDKKPFLEFFGMLGSIIFKCSVIFMTYGQ